MEFRRVPPAALARLPRYVQSLRTLADQGVELVSSQEMASATGIEASQIRRDLSYLGAFGTPGVGYDVRGLLRDIAPFLGLYRDWPVALLGCGTLGSALASHYADLMERNFRIVAVFDRDPKVVGSTVGGQPVLPLELLPDVVKEKAIKIAIVAVSADCVQEVASSLASSGIKAILNLTPRALPVSPDVTVRHVDLAAEIQILSFQEAMKHAPASAARSSQSGRSTSPSA